MPRTRCLGCNQLTDTAPRCDTCRRTKERQRNQARQGYYGTTYRTRRAAALNDATHCWICGEPLTPHPWPHPQSTSCDHVTPGDPNSELRPAHLGCNASRRRTPN